MEENKAEVFGDTHTMKMTPSSIKTIPLICSWCNSIYKLDKWDVAPEKRTGVSHGLCKKCYKKMLKEQPSFFEKPKEKCKKTDTKRKIKISKQPKFPEQKEIKIIEKNKSKTFRTFSFRKK